MEGLSAAEEETWEGRGGEEEKRIRTGRRTGRRGMRGSERGGNI